MSKNLRGNRMPNEDDAFQASKAYSTKSDRAFVVRAGNSNKSPPRDPGADCRGTVAQGCSGGAHFVELSAGHTGCPIAADTDSDPVTLVRSVQRRKEHLSSGYATEERLRSFRSGTEDRTSVRAQAMIRARRAEDRQDGGGGGGSAWRTAA